jgi:xanthine dehydrogenase YagS FAD-binding subunit
VLGTSPACIANYPGDLAVALVALDAEIETQRPTGLRLRRPVEGLYRLPGDRPDLETVLEPGEMILSIEVPLAPWSASTYHKVRDRASYAFALASAVVALRLGPDGRVEEARLALGGLASRPWRCRTAEAALRGRRLTEATAWDAAALALEGADAEGPQAFKIDLGGGTVVRALLDAAGRAAVAHAGALPEGGA